MEKIDEIKDEPIIGKFYLVEHAILFSNDDFEYKDPIGFVPILGKKHTDKQLGVDYEHFHIDGRFFKKNNKLGFDVDDEGKTNNIIPTKPNGYWGSWTHAPKTIYKKSKCVRLTTGIKPPKKAIKYWNWYDEQIGKSCKGKICPHLKHKMNEVDGKLVCPLHGLTGSIKDEVIIKINNFNVISESFDEFLKKE